MNQLMKNNMNCQEELINSILYEQTLNRGIINE